MLHDRQMLDLETSGYTGDFQRDVGLDGMIDVRQKTAGAAVTNKVTPVWTSSVAHVPDAISSQPSRLVRK